MNARFDIAVYVDDLTLCAPSGYLMDSTVLAVKIDFEVTNIDQLHWLLGI
jgi:hypothetical protein